MEKQQLQSENETLVSEKEVRTTRLQELENQVTGIEESLKEKNNQNEALTNERNSILTEIDSFKTEIANMTTDAETLKEENASLSESSRTVEEQYRSLSQELENVTESKKSLTEEVTTLKKENERLPQLQLMNNSMRGVQDSLKNNALTLLAKVESLEKENEELKNAPSGRRRSATSVDASQEELDRLNLIEDNFNSIQQKYQDYAQMEDRILNTRGDTGLLETKLALDEFLTLGLIEETFPGLWGRIKKYDKAFEEAGRTDALQRNSEIVYDLAQMESAGERQSYIEEEMGKNRNSPLMLSFLEELKYLINF